MVKQTGIILSEQDAKRIESAMREVERRRNYNKPYYRRNYRTSPSTAGDTTQLAIITQVPEYDNPVKDRYIVQKCALVEGVYTGDATDITIDRVLGYEGYPIEGCDIRNYVPWYKVNSIVRIVQQWDVTAGALKWFLDMPLFYCGAESEASLRWDEAEGLTQAVWA